MHRKKISSGFNIITCLLLLSVTVTNAGCQKLPALDELQIRDIEVTQEQRDIIYQHLKDFPDFTEVSLAFIREGQVSYYGVIIVDGTMRDTLNRSNLFEIGSITKVFTSTLLAGMVLDSFVSLDDPVTKHLSIKLKDDIQITFKQLANHTSGLPSLPKDFMAGALFHMDDPYRHYDNEKLVKYMTERVDMVTEPGSTYAYSNLGAGFLGYALGEISGHTYEQMLQDEIFNKYGMSASTSVITRVNGSLVQGRNASGKPTSNWDLASLVAAGGIFSSVEDLAKFALSQFDSTNLELALTRRETFRDGSTNLGLGLGWHLVKAPDG